MIVEAYSSYKTSKKGGGGTEMGTITISEKSTPLFFDDL